MRPPFSSIFCWGTCVFSGRVSRTVELFWRRGGGVAAVRASRRRRGSYSGVAAAAWRGVLKYPASSVSGAHADSTLVHATWGSYTGCGAALSMRCWRATFLRRPAARLKIMGVEALSCCATHLLG